MERTDEEYAALPCLSDDNLMAEYARFLLAIDWAKYANQGYFLEPINLFDTIKKAPTK